MVILGRWSLAPDLQFNPTRYSMMFIILFTENYVLFLDTDTLLKYILIVVLLLIILLPTFFHKNCNLNEASKTEKLLRIFPDGFLPDYYRLEFMVPWRRVERPAIGLRTPFTLTKPAYLSSIVQPFYFMAVQLYLYIHYVVKISYIHDNK